MSNPSSGVVVKIGKTHMRDAESRRIVILQGALRCLLGDSWLRGHVSATGMHWRETAPGPKISRVLWLVTQQLYGADPGLLVFTGGIAECRGASRAAADLQIEFESIALRARLYLLQYLDAADELRGRLMRGREASAPPGRKNGPNPVAIKNNHDSNSPRSAGEPISLPVFSPR
jgi:hypothetical protein